MFIKLEFLVLLRLQVVLQNDLPIFYQGQPSRKCVQIYVQLQKDDTCQYSILYSFLKLIQNFPLIKFTSNRKGVLKSVPENHRKDDVKNRDLDGKLPEERALGICWDTERDTFKFQIDLKEKQMRFPPF